MHRVPNGEVYNCSRKASDSKKESVQHLLTNTKGSLPRGAGLLIIWTISPAITKSQVKEVGFQ